MWFAKLFHGEHDQPNIYTDLHMPMGLWDISDYTRESIPYSDRSKAIITVYKWLELRTMLELAFSLTEQGERLSLTRVEFKKLDSHNQTVRHLGKVFSKRYNLQRLPAVPSPGEKKAKETFDPPEPPEDVCSLTRSGK